MVSLAAKTPNSYSPSVMRRRATKIDDAARGLLRTLGVLNPADAADGPGDIEIQELLASVEDRDEDLIVEATDRIGRLVEVIKAVQAAKLIQRHAQKATGDVVRIGN